MDSVFWAPTQLVQDYGFYFVVAFFGLAVSLALVASAVMIQIRRKTVHPVFVITILGLISPLVLEILGVNLLTPMGRAYVVGYSLFGFCVLTYGTLFRRRAGWMPLFVLPVVAGVSYWCAAIGAEITASI